ncbi:SDR family NAD(P)-dependent oxidoreductase [Gordonia amicalis]|uniref:SDR family NAD(P)-dependent oxidoreductase n=1 Tax=Gordonia amicalis TaxID=89053 RepID=UPI0022B555EC|nr:SDR family NAD(P)-dependent oxidoreductase [Gordonia amicalis]MCZ4578912.1 SDR family NAD(P)-dependent oxidoreductase [Gordonia amicalis]
MIAGAGQGLGLALVRRALEAGHNVVATTRRVEFPITDPRLTVLRVDVTDRQACHVAVERAVAECGRLDVLVNNAGYGLVGAIEEVDEGEARAIIDTDLLGPLWMSQAALPVMREQRSGHIVQISSVGGVGAMPFFGLYNAAKWGLEGFSEALADEVAAFGVRVTIAEIGSMDTEWATGSMRFSQPKNVYDAIRAERLGTAAVPWPHDPGATGGGTSPAAVAERLVAHIADPEPGRLRLLIGEDAPSQVAVVLDRRAREYAAQAHA